ncbi:MAG: hypothetical protein ABI675_14235 [Chitinophagaceae bacterium]
MNYAALSKGEGFPPHPGFFKAVTVSTSPSPEGEGGRLARSFKAILLTTALLLRRRVKLVSYLL